MQPTPDAVPPGAPQPVEDAPPSPRPAPRRRSRRQEATIVLVFAVATMALVAVLLRFTLGAADARRLKAGALGVLPAPPGQCAVAPDGRILGKVVTVLGRGGVPESYRLEEWPGHGVAPAASTLTVRASEAKLTPCAELPQPGPNRPGR